MKVELKIALIILIMLFFGFLRENFFFHINFSIDKSGFGMDHEVPAIWQWMKGWQISNLKLLKWVATLVFALIFLALTLWLVSELFPTENNKFLVLISFGSVLLLSMTAMLMGKMIPVLAEKIYYFSRWLMGSVQSPLFPGIITLFIYYNNRMRNNKNQQNTNQKPE